jgi:hypothetical protein
VGWAGVVCWGSFVQQKSNVHTIVNVSYIVEKYSNMVPYMIITMCVGGYINILDTNLAFLDAKRFFCFSMLVVAVVVPKCK